jgi:hypothetical protein
MAKGYGSAICLAVAVGLVGLGGMGCERPPSAGSLKEWTPADHDRAEEQQAGQGGAANANPNTGGNQGPAARNQPGAQPQPGSAEQRPEPPRKSSRGDGGGANLVEVTWETACAPCHGPVGHGDGPNGPMVNAPDITRDDLLSKITDDEIAFQIRNGKNRMPKFDLPDPVVRGLVARIRAMRGR